MLRASAIRACGAAALLGALLLGPAGCTDSGAGGAAYPDRERERLYRYGRLGGESGLLGFDFASGSPSGGAAEWRANHAL